jgi:hypothetical protein
MVTETGVWPSEESPNFFHRAMIGYGDSRDLADVPGFLLDETERDDLAGLVRWALISGWSGLVLSPTSPFGFALTDDDWIGMFGESRDVVHGWLEEWLGPQKVRCLWEGEIAGEG